MFLWARHPTELMDLCQHVYGKMFTLRLPGFAPVMTADRAVIRTMFAAKPDEMHGGRFNFILRPLVGDSSVLLLDGDEHLQRRRLLLPPLHGERMRVYGASMADITRRTIEGFPVGVPFKLHPHTQEITLQVILRTVFGAEEGGGMEALSGQIKHMLAQLEQPLSFWQLLHLAQHPQKEDKVPWKWLLRRRNATDALLYELIAAGRRDPAQHMRKDVLALLLSARDDRGQGLSDRDLRNELIAALAAGHETTATSLAWAVERLLSNPEQYARLRDEVRALGSDPAPEQLVALPYLDATLKEVLRLRPVIPILGRVLMKPYTFGGYDLPAGTALIASVYLVHRDPEVYPDPEAFRPERFLEGQPDGASYFPFGGGVRRCTGAAFAMYEMKIVLGTMLALCDLELAQRSPVRAVRRAVTLWPRGGTRVRALRVAA